MEENKFIKLPESELEVMQGIWALHAEGEANISAGVVMKRFPELKRLKLTTVLTLITRLQLKGFIRSEKQGRANCYTPIIDEAAYKSFIAADFVDRVFRGSKTGLMTALAACGGFTAEEASAVKALLAEAEAAK